MRGKLYVYPSSDTVPPEGRKANDFCMPGYRMFVLEGGWSTWETIETELTEPVDGVHNLVVVFKPDWGGTKLVNLDWLKLLD